MWAQSKVYIGPLEANIFLHWGFSLKTPNTSCIGGFISCIGGCNSESPIPLVLGDSMDSMQLDIGIKDKNVTSGLFGHASVSTSYHVV